MAALQWTSSYVERVWGRKDLVEPFTHKGPNPIGEVWFEDPMADHSDLMVKYLFTSAPLSIQVHPTNAQARALGYDRGKDEAWLVLDAEPGSVIGLGLKDVYTEAQVRAAAMDGTIEQMMHWQLVEAGDFIFSPAGTVHAIGAGLRLIEIQQKLDLTYRFYDFGRPRPLQLEEALSVAKLGPYMSQPEPVSAGAGRSVIARGGAFMVERWTGPFHGSVRGSAATLIIVPVAGTVRIGSLELTPGSVWSIGEDIILDTIDGDFLVSYSGSSPIANLR